MNFKTKYKKYKISKKAINLTSQNIVPISKKKIGVVITTCGNNSVFVIQLLNSYEHFLPKNHYKVLFINERTDLDLEKLKRYSKLEVIFIEDQQKNNGLTGTWNQGIDLCFKNSCETIILSNDDILVTPNIKHIIDEAAACSKNDYYYYGPLTNEPGPCNQSQFSLEPKNEESRILIQNGKIWNLNGFFMVFPKHVLIKNKYNEKLYFDEKNYPFGGNETEWFKRFLLKNGKPILVPKTFVYHYKLKLWRKTNGIEQSFNNTCIFTCVTGGYENVIYLDNTEKNHNWDILYYTDSLDLMYKCIKKNIKPFLLLNNFTDNPKLLQRHIKTDCFRYLPSQYTNTVWVDGNVLLKMTDLNKYDLEENELVCFRHPLIESRKCVQDEVKRLLEIKLITKPIFNYIQHIFTKHDFKDNVGITETCVLIRKKTENIMKMNEEWGKMVLMCPRDQCSFDFLKWKHKIKYLSIPDVKDRPVTRLDHGNPKNRKFQKGDSMLKE